MGRLRPAVLTARRGRTLRQPSARRLPTSRAGIALMPLAHRGGEPAGNYRSRRSPERQRPVQDRPGSRAGTMAGQRGGAAPSADPGCSRPPPSSRCRLSRPAIAIICALLSRAPLPKAWSWALGVFGMLTAEARVLRRDAGAIRAVAAGAGRHLARGDAATVDLLAQRHRGLVVANPGLAFLTRRTRRCAACPRPTGPPPCPT